jgi:glycosyltransferase involved in cell wall biosynthesis
MPESYTPYDIVHVVHGTYPEDPRVRREANVASDVATRVAVVALRQVGRPSAGRYGRVRIVRLPGAKSRGGALDYVREYGAFTLRVFALFARDPRFRHARVVHVHTLPDFLVFAAIPAMRVGARAILDLHEIFPEFIRSRFDGPAGVVAGAVARWLERGSRRLASVTITVNEPIRELLASRPAGRQERIEVVHNLTDPRDLGSPAPRSYQLGSPVRLVYHGTLTPLYGLDIALDAIAIASRSVRVSLDIYGDGPARQALESRAVHLGLENAVRFHGNVPHGALRKALPGFDAGLIPTRLDVMTRYSLSTKLLELFHLEIPVIAPRIPTYQSYFPDECAWYYDPNDSGSAARAILRFAAAPEAERAARVAAAGRAMGGLQWATDASHLAGIYRQLLREPAGAESP